MRDTITRVNSINSAIDTALTANVNAIDSNLAARVDQTLAVETAMLANVTAANARVDAANTSITNLSNRVNSVNTAIDIALTTNLALKADSFSPSLSGVPTAPTAAFGSNSTQIATCEYVDTRSVFWDGSRKFVSTSDPTVSDGSDGDIWFKYIP